MSIGVFHYNNVGDVAGFYSLVHKKLQILKRFSVFILRNITKVLTRIIKKLKKG